MKGEETDTAIYRQEARTLTWHALAYTSTKDKRARVPTFEELVPKQSGIDAKLARGIEEDHDWRWVEGSNGYEPSTTILDGWTIVAFALPEEFPNVEAAEYFLKPIVLKPLWTSSCPSSKA